MAPKGCDAFRPNGPLRSNSYLDLLNLYIASLPLSNSQFRHSSSELILLHFQHGTPNRPWLIISRPLRMSMLDSLILSVRQFYQAFPGSMHCSCFHSNRAKYRQSSPCFFINKKYDTFAPYFCVLT